MARTKQTARKTPAGTPQPPPPDRSVLLQLMGFPFPHGEEASPLTVNADWEAVVARLQSNPEEAGLKLDRYGSIYYIPSEEIEAIKGSLGDYYDYIEKLPLFLALINQSTPVTVAAVEALIEAYPELVTDPRTDVLVPALLYNSNNDNNTHRQRILDVISRYNPHLATRERPRLWEFMGFPRSLEEFPTHDCTRYAVDWEAMAGYLKEAPHEANIICRAWRRRRSNLFPLEAALHFWNPPPTFEVVELLLRHGPLAVTDDSSALYKSCCCRRQTDSRVILAILQANPRLAECWPGDYFEFDDECDMPLQKAFYLPCAMKVLPALIQAYPASLSLSTDDDDYERIPLFQAAGNYYSVSNDVFKLLLEEGMRYKVGVEVGSCCGLITSEWKKCSHTLANIISMIFESWVSAVSNNDDMKTILWERLCLCIRAAGASKTGEADPASMWDYPLLHGAIEFAKSQVLFDRILTENPGDVAHTDLLGRTSLTVAIERAGSQPQEGHDDEHINYQVIIRRLLDDAQGGSSQLAARTLNDGSLPLHFALRLCIQGYEIDNCLIHLVHAYPLALEVPDPKTGLFPCLFAAVGERASISTIFGLMRERPDLVVRSYFADQQERTNEASIRTNGNKKPRTDM